jgi:hypothetical protein
MHFSTLEALTKKIIMRRRIQVRMMAEIYRKTTLDYIWLGRDMRTESAYDPIEFLRYLSLERDIYVLSRF